MSNPEKVIKYFTTEYQAFSGVSGVSDISNKIYYMNYDPMTINLMIKENKQKTASKINFYKAVYNKYLYNLFVLEFINSLDVDIDKNIRKKIFDIIEKIKPNDNSQIKLIH